jgi:hypothetical protein
MQLAQTDINTDYSLHQLNREAAPTQNQTDYGAVPAWIMRETRQLRKLRLKTTKIMQPGANRHQHRLFAALAQSRSSADSD